MRNIERASASQALFVKGASAAAARGLPVWSPATTYGAGPSIVMPRVRDNLVLRLVAGRAQERDRGPIHAIGAT